MSRVLVIGLFVLVAWSIGMLIKWEYKRFKRRQPRGSKAFRRHLEELRNDEPGRAYAAPPDRVKRAFEHDGGRR